jgi:hypothetical protein
MKHLVAFSREIWQFIRDLRKPDPMWLWYTDLLRKARRRDRTREAKRQARWAPPTQREFEALKVRNP